MSTPLLPTTQPFSHTFSHRCRVTADPCAGKPRECWVSAVGERGTDICPAFAHEHAGAPAARGVARGPGRRIFGMKPRALVSLLAVLALALLAGCGGSSSCSGAGAEPGKLAP